MGGDRDDVWPVADESEAQTAEVRPPARAEGEGRREAIRKWASSSDLQALALLEVSAAIDRLTLVLKDERASK